MGDKRRFDPKWPLLPAHKTPIFHTSTHTFSHKQAKNASKIPGKAGFIRHEI